MLPSEIMVSYTIATYKQILQHYKKLQDIIMLLDLDELSEDDRKAVPLARKVERFVSESLIVEILMGSSDNYGSLADCILGFNGVLNVEYTIIILSNKCINEAIEKL